MIPQAALQAYLERPLEDHLWVKKLTGPQLDAALATLNPKPKVPHLRDHQKACFILGVAYPGFCFWNDLGSGKTILALELLRYWWQAGKLRRGVVFLKSDKAFDTWETQARKFGFDLPITALSGSSVQKWQQLEEFGEGLVLLPCPGATAMTSTPIKVKGKMRWKLDNKLVDRLAAWTEAFVIDESTVAGHHNSLTFQLLYRLKKKANYRYALAGRPFGRDPTMLWAQHLLVDDGETLGETLGLFRAAFFTEKKNYWGGPYSKDYKFKTKLKPVLSKMMRHRSITYSSDECGGLPAVVPIHEVVRLPEEAGAYYARMVESLREAKGNMRELKNVFLRMRQLSSGFMGFKDDESGEKVEISFDENPKLERLLELIEEVPEGRGATIFYEYTHSGRQIVEKLKKLKYRPIWLWSGTKDARAELARFAKEEQPVAVINNRVGAYSIDGLQHTANYLFVYESPVSSIDREQMERRLIRDGQKHKVFQFDLVCKGTADEKILQFHKQGKDLFQALLRNPEKALLV